MEQTKPQRLKKMINWTIFGEPIRDLELINLCVIERALQISMKKTDYAIEAKVKQRDSQFIKHNGLPT